MLYPYSFEKKYDYKDVNVEYDDKEEMLYVLHNEKKLYFPYLDSEKVRRDYNLLIMEQDEESPHRYFDNNVCVNEGDIFVDVGAAEGIISLDVIERASEVFLIECSDKWRKALGRTFDEYKEKVHIIEKIAGLETDDTSIRIDSLLNEYKGKRIILKMDVEGMELDVLKGARNTLANNECFVTCATYHTEEAAKEIAEFFEKEGYTYNYSDGYMLFYYGYMTFFNGKYTRIKPPYFRRGIIRARKDTSGFEGKEKND